MMFFLNFQTRCGQLMFDIFVALKTSRDRRRASCVVLQSLVGLLSAVMTNASTACQVAPTTTHYTQPPPCRIHNETSASSSSSSASSCSFIKLVILLAQLAHDARTCRHRVMWVQQRKLIVYQTSWWSWLFQVPLRQAMRLRQLVPEAL